MRICVAIILLFCGVGVVAAQDQPTAEQQEFLKKQVNIELTFQNPPEKWSRLSFNRGDSVVDSGQTKIRYSINAPKLDPTKKYSLMPWPLGAKSPQVGLPAVEVDANGLLHCAKDRTDCPGGAGAAVAVAVPDVPGMPTRFIITEDKTPVAMGEVIPTPIKGTDQACTIEVTILAPSAALTVISAQGFTPGEALKFTSTSYDDKVENSYTANEKGEFQTIDLPGVKGHDDGMSTVTVQGAKCKPSAQFHWGAQTPAAATPAAAPTSPKPTPQ
ncbi:hypothetical protein [Candidatus Korobacter versatilis]|nr:hypothetical protein [Candidatus Koribacter versatilis]